MPDEPMSMATVNMVGYRIIRPDNTLLWDAMAASVDDPVWPPLILPPAPWRYEMRLPGSTEWTLIHEQQPPTPEQVAVLQGIERAWRAEVEALTGRPALLPNDIPDVDAEDFKRRWRAAREAGALRPVVLPTAEVAAQRRAEARARARRAAWAVPLHLLAGIAVVILLLALAAIVLPVIL